jgi:hypothetical protein
VYFVALDGFKGEIAFLDAASNHSTFLIAIGNVRVTRTLLFR